MKCPMCCGDGWVLKDITCDACNGTGIVEPLTNDEWRRTCSTEEFAEWMAQYYCDVNTSDVKEILKKEWLEWLKQPHTTE